MGTPYHNHHYRMDNKVYRLLFPQKPLVATSTANEYDFQQYPSGTNAIVAVISYTGYDMEDAMILNKSAYERGFGHGCVYKSVRHELNETTQGASSRTKQKFRLIRANLNQEDQRLGLAEKNLDSDGFPPISQKLEYGSAEFAIYDNVLQRAKFMSHKDNESARIDSIRLMGDEKDNPSKT